ncbi:MULTISPECIES: hypothetical protein [unclassified Mesorhizobium]|uniref:hypothetical protein n=1 Tax=unclassified Mesorhizobium TaxID=325217 RepID=UPI00167794C1|nr:MULTISPECIES: hypothetical protein [unclassified Mesorhizobium]
MPRAYAWNRHFADGSKQDFIACHWGRQVRLSPRPRCCGSSSISELPHGVRILSDVVVGRELGNGSLVKAHPLSLPGYSFYVVWMHHNPRSAMMETFLAWMRTVL